MLNNKLITAAKDAKLESTEALQNQTLKITQGYNRVRLL